MAVGVRSKGGGRNAPPISMRTPLALLIALLLSLSPLALANDGEDDEDRNDERRDGSEGSRGEGARGKDDENEDEDEDEHRVERVKRKVHMDVSGQEAQIKMARASGGSEDEIKVHYVANSGSMKLEYKSENATTETETELKVRFKEILEFRDLDGDGAYDPNDTVVARYPVGALDWTVVGPDPVNSSSGTPGQRLSGVGRFADGGALVLALYVYGDFATLNGTSLRPSEVKIDVILDHFPFQANDTLPALIVKSEQESEIEVEGEEEGMEASAGGLTAYFSWADNATVDGVPMPVHTTMLSNEAEDEKKEARFAISYARGTYVNHDPLLGVQSAAIEEANVVPGAGVIVLVATIGVAAFVLRRRS